jgi:hypothetical protein
MIGNRHGSEPGKGLDKTFSLAPNGRDFVAPSAPLTDAIVIAIAITIAMLRVRFVMPTSSSSDDAGSDGNLAHWLDDGTRGRHDVAVPSNP